MSSRLVILGALLLFAGPVRSQDENRGDPRKAIAKYERYLERKPLNEWAFDQMVDAAIQLNELEQLVETYRATVEGDATNAAARVVLARLLAQTDQVDEALEELARIEDKQAGHYQLVGTLELRRGEPAAAVAALELAVSATDDERLLESLHRARGEAWLAAGERDKAAAAFAEMANIDPTNFNLRLEAAASLAENSLTEEALAAFEEAERLAGNDTAKRCRVLSEIGRLHERLAQGDEALAVYDRAIALMGRGNWLKRDLLERVIALHKRSGSLEALVARAAAAAESGPKDLDALEFHARVLAEGEQYEASRDALIAAADLFPSDLALSRRLIDILHKLDDKDAVIVEYQRILVERPAELELYVELGQVFASEGALRFGQAPVAEVTGEPAGRSRALHSARGAVRPVRAAR